MDWDKILVDELEKYIEEVRENGRKKSIVIYGAGQIGEALGDLLLANGVDVYAYAVTEPGYNAMQIHGIPVYAFRDLYKEHYDCIYLVAAKMPTAAAIERQLQETGVEYLAAPPHIGILVYPDFRRPCLEITPKVGCIVQCRYCPQALFLSNYFQDNLGRTNEMNLASFKICIDKMPKNMLIEFAGFVEPFLAQEATAMMRYAHESGHDITLFTTLVGCNIEKFKEIEDIPFRRVVLHVADVHGYANIPLTDDYFRLLRYVSEKKKVNGRWFIDKANCQAEPHPAVADILKDKVTISWKLVDRAGNLDDETNSELLHSNMKKGNIICERSAGLNHNILLPDGTVILCCMDFGMKHMLGNLLEESWEDIQESEEMQRLKSSLSSYDKDSLCRHCTASVSIEELI
ncbi:MAG: hypothetical protein E7197_04670 [Anaerovibrio sp.]|uniref:SPASM domain-containing protein n=1 Tax=Anaerovibrio sp. TaxID=1872532 RepID=UPI0025BBE14D|nr:SPASM domain-containing protein [Anaerovibrio sp.]MBE6099328.1 hypothetical protein [Anaerovibrio sp.]